MVELPLRMRPSTSFRYRDAAYTLEGYSELDDIYKRIVATRQFYEAPVLERIKRNRAIGVYVDVGANMGNHSVFFLNECESQCVISIEANGELIPILSKNIQANNPQSKPFVILNELITTHDKVYFHISDENQNIGMSYFSLENKTGKGRQRDGISLDRAILPLLKGKKVALVKIDVEGQELDVLASGTQLIRRYRPLICAEVFPENFVSVSRYLGGIQYGLLERLPAYNYLFAHTLSYRYLQSLLSNGLRAFAKKVVNHLSPL